MHRKTAVLLVVPLWFLAVALSPGAAAAPSMSAGDQRMIAQQNRELDSQALDADPATGQPRFTPLPGRVRRPRTRAARPAVPRSSDAWTPPSRWPGTSYGRRFQDFREVLCPDGAVKTLSHGGSHFLCRGAAGRQPVSVGAWIIAFSVAVGSRSASSTYGNWVTHGSQIEEDAAPVHAALDPASRPSTPPTSTPRPAEEILGEALKGQRREGSRSSPRSTGRWAKGPTTRALAQAHPRGIDASLRRLRTDYVDLYQAHRYDHETPLEETMQAFADVVRPGKALYIGVSEWTRRADPRRQRAGRRSSVPLVSNQPQYSALYRVIEAEVVPDLRELGISQVVWSPIGQGVLTGKYQPGQAPPEGSRATDEAGGARFISGCCGTTSSRRAAARSRWPTRPGLSMAELAARVGAAGRERRGRDHRRLASRAGARQRPGGERPPRPGAQAAHGRDPHAVTEGESRTDEEPKPAGWLPSDFFLLEDGDGAGVAQPPRGCPRLVVLGDADRVVDVPRSGRRACPRSAPCSRWRTRS